MSSSIMLLKSKRRFQVSLDIALLWWNCKITFKLHIKIRSNLENYRIIEQTDRSMRVLNRFFRTQISFIWSSGFTILKQNLGETQDWKYTHGISNIHVAIRIMGLHKNLIWEDRIEDPHWGASSVADLCTKHFAKFHLIMLVLPLRELKK